MKQISIAERLGVELQTEIYDPAIPNLFAVYVKILKKSGPPILVRLPLYDPEAIDGHIEDIYSKLMEVCRNGLEPVAKYAKE